jgi:hypothetical protein
MNDELMRMLLRELRDMNKTLTEIKDRLPVPAQYTIPDGQDGLMGK